MTKAVEEPLAAVGVGAMSDEALIVRYRQVRDRGAFEELVRRYQAELYNYLRRFLGNGTLAEDAFQVTFLQVHLKCDQFQEDRKFRPWLYTIATNQAIDAQRRNRRHRALSLDRTGRDDQVGSLGEFLASHEVLPELRMESSQARDWIRAAVEELPEVFKSVVHLVYYQGLKYREAADVLDVPVGTIKSRMHSAVTKLNEAWLRDHPDAPP